MTLTREQIEALGDRVAKIRADLDDFDGDRRGHYAALVDAEKDLRNAAPDLRLAALSAMDERDALRAEVAKLRDAGSALIDFYNGPAEAKRPDIFARLMQQLGNALGGENG